MTLVGDLLTTESAATWDRVSPADPVVVIGAGIMGCSAAYHLLKAGARDVTVLDAHPPGGGTTSAGAGFVALWAAGRMQVDEPGLGLESYGLAFYGALNSAGHPIAYRNNGNLVLALTAKTWRRSVVQVAEHPAASPGTRIIDPQEIARITGVVNADAVHGAVLMPTAIQVETGMAVQAIASLIARMGGTLRSGITVEGFSANNGKVSAVVTSRGAVRASAVVVAAGAWTNSVLQHLGMKLPLLRVVASRLVTEPLGIPDTMPTIQCDDFGMWIRESAGRFTWGSFSAYRVAYRVEQREGPIAPGQPRSEVLMELQRGEQGRLEPIFPRLSGATVACWRQGMPTYTPDGQPIADHLPTYDNVVVVGGDNESGIGHGPGIWKGGRRDRPGRCHLS